MIYGTLKVIAAVVAVSLGVLKVLMGHRSYFLLPAPLFFATAALEIIAGSLLLTRRAAWGALALLALAIGGVVTSLVFKGVECGCLAGISRSFARDHLTVTGAIGTVASLLVVRELSGIHPRVHKPRASSSDGLD